jgi:hypothetical protein
MNLIDSSPKIWTRFSLSDDFNLANLDDISSSFDAISMATAIRQTIVEPLCECAQ